MKQCPLHHKDCHTQMGAIRAALRCSRKRGTPLRPYYHRACGAWHLTKRPRVDTNVGKELTA